MMITPPALFIFRRDLRVHDNTALNQAARKGYAIAPLFILDPRQLERNTYRSEPAVRFMVECLESLDTELRALGGCLTLREGKAEHVVKEMLREGKFRAVFVNTDYTPFSRSRDRAISHVCQSAGVSFFSFDDSVLNAPGEVLKADGTPYTMFTPYYRRAVQRPVRLPARMEKDTRFWGIAGGIRVSKLRRVCGVPGSGAVGGVTGGRKSGLRTVDHIRTLHDYPMVRDRLATDGTTGVSPWLKFGAISVREVAEATRGLAGCSADLLTRQLYWRDFYYQIALHFPHVFGQAFQERFRRVRWSRSRRLFNAWCRGQTGFPVVDAGIRELNETGWMHNRARMIAASFLTKDLHIDWRWGEQYFATRLIDYDPAVNNGNWQWVASTGCDAQPYFRVFNPWLQQKKYDPDCTYIRRWVPELRHVKSTTIHNCWKPGVNVDGYPNPVVDHTTEARKAKGRFGV